MNPQLVREREMSGEKKEILAAWSNFNFPHTGSASWSLQNDIQSHLPLPNFQNMTLPKGLKESARFLLRHGVTYLLYPDKTSLTKGSFWKTITNQLEFN